MSAAPIAADSETTAAVEAATVGSAVDDSTVDDSNSGGGAGAPTDSLLRVIEVWTPSVPVPDTRGGEPVDAAPAPKLRLASGCYRRADAFAARSGGLEFDADTGLPGRVFAAGVPVVFDDLQGPGFLRREEAKRDQLTAGLGVPVFSGGEIAAVVVMLFGSAAEGQAAAALETWIPDRERNELALGAAYYANLRRFEMISRHVQFPYGSGLPGEVRAAGEPRLLTDLGRSGAFIRAAGAEAEGLSIALAWPLVDYGDDIRAVIVLLSSHLAPLAKVWQVWHEHTGDDGTTRLVPVRNVSESHRELAERLARQPVSPGVGLLGRAWQAGTPEACGDFEGEREAEALAAAGVTGALAFPVFAGTRMTGLIALWT